MVTVRLPLSISCFYPLTNTIQPFVLKGHPIHQFFPDRYYAILIPVILLVTGLSVVGLFLGSVLLKGKKKKTA
jgi:dolichyl-phosphate mannosyltransferase polypeptide 2 regulatory subunit